MAVLLLFFCSGATALIYEVVWSKYLALLFGSTIQAQTVVLAVFMGGLAVGNKLFSRRADTARHPLAIYGLIEIAIGIYALAFPLIHKIADALFSAAGSRLLDHGGWLLMLKGTLSVLLLAGPTILMGGTLPVLAAWLQRSTPDAGRRSARFYSTNSLGAVCGAGLTGFLLVRWLGIPFTMGLAALVNLVIGSVALRLSSKMPSAIAVPADPVPADDPPALPSERAVAAADPPPASPHQGHADVSRTASPTAKRASARIFRWGCVLVAITGGVSMGLEVLASRCLCLIFGASLQVFSIVLMAFILGIGVGSAVIASPRRKPWPKEITTVTLLLCAAAFLGLLVYNIENLVVIYLHAQGGLTRSPMGFWYHQVMTSLISIGVLSLPAAALGSVLPLWIRVVGEEGSLLGERVGRLLTWNTLGAVIGVILTGFVLMPHIGLRDSFTVLGLVLAVAAIVTALSTLRPYSAAAGVFVTAFLILVTANGRENWRYVIGSGAFRLPSNESAYRWLHERRQRMTLLFYEDAADATVSVELGEDTVKGPGLRINGKPDASSFGDLSTQRLLALLPLMSNPTSKDVFCFGMGSGITAATALHYPIDRLTVAENCEPVLRAVRFFEPWNEGLWTNSRVRIFTEDARTVLKLSPRQYDVIIAEPSNPWTVGVGSVFSLEFYQLAARRLKPGGIMSQWFHIYEMDDDTLELVIRTFATVFPHMEIWDADGTDLIMLGSAQPWKSGSQLFQQAFEMEGPRRDLAEIGIKTPEAALARRFASQRTAFAVPQPGPIQRDAVPILEYDAPRAFYIHLETKGVERFEHFDERTWQWGILSAEDRDALNRIDPMDLKTLFFGIYTSLNLHLQDYLKTRIEGGVGTQVLRNRAMPCVFQGTNLVMYAAPSYATNALVRQLYAAEHAIRTEPEKESLAVASIRDALDAVRDYDPGKADWSAAYYANLAVTVSLRRGDPAQAKAILLRALQLDPDSPELAYLSRILIRQGILNPAEIRH
jgi:spermidine synthase